MTPSDPSFLTAQSDILKVLLQSKEEGTSIGIRAGALGSDTMVTCVEDIIFEEHQTLIVLKHYDSTGYILPSHKINLSEVQGVCPFSTPFLNPFLENIEKDRTWYF